jgi:hypothetical protein
MKTQIYSCIMGLLLDGTRIASKHILCDSEWTMGFWRSFIQGMIFGGGTGAIARRP